MSLLLSLFQFRITSAGVNGHYNKLNSSFGAALEGEKACYDANAKNADSSLNGFLSLWTSYVEEENHMLARRVGLLSEAEGAAKVLAKATLSGKPAKTTAALQAKEHKDSELRKATTLGEQEIRRFHQQRLLEMKESLISYTQGQIKVAKDTHDRLSKSVALLKAFQLPKQANVLSSSGLQQEDNGYSGMDAMHIPE